LSSSSSSLSSLSLSSSSSESSSLLSLSLSPISTLRLKVSCLALLGVVWFPYFFSAFFRERKSVLNFIKHRSSFFTQKYRSKDF
jgi:hypothetical protein